jgi:hypothetical protein
MQAFSHTTTFSINNGQYILHTSWHPDCEFLGTEHISSCRLWFWCLRMIETMQLGMGKSVVSCCCNSSLVYMSQAASQVVHFSLGMARRIGLLLIILLLRFDGLHFRGLEFSIVHEGEVLIVSIYIYVSPDVQTCPSQTRPPNVSQYVA